MIYIEHPVLRPVSSNPVLRLENQNSHSKSCGPDMKIPSSDPLSAHQIGPDDVLMTSVGGCYTNVLPNSSDQFDCSRGYRLAMKILCPDSESTQKTSLDTG